MSSNREVQLGHGWRTSWRRRDVRKVAGCVALLAIVLGIGLAAMKETDARPPNVLFIMADEMRWDVLGYQGHPTVKTPHLDALADSGVRFSAAYTVAPICRAARWSAFTGRYAHVHGVLDNLSPANDGEVLLTSLLKHHGYATAISGKLHLLPANLDHDFDDFWSNRDEGPGIHDRYSTFMRQKYGSPNVHPMARGSSPYPNDVLGRDIGRFPYPKEDFMSYWITDRAVEYMESRVRVREPWFLFVSYKVPHSPYRAPEPYWSMYPPESFDVPEIPPEVARRRAAAKDDWTKRHSVDNEGLLRALTAQYFGHVTNVDDNVGRLLDQLTELGFADDTIVIFTSDHGNMLGDRGLFFKGSLYDGATRIPQIIRVPANSPHAPGFRGGKLVDSLVENIDLVPTLLELCGLPIPEQGIQGRSLVSLVMGTNETWEERVFSERLGQMLLTPEYRLHLADLDDPRGQRENTLYDRKLDPNEEHDVSGDPKYAAIQAELVHRIKTWQANRPPPVRIPGMETPTHPPQPQLPTLNSNRPRF